MENITSMPFVNHWLIYTIVKTLLFPSRKQN